MVTCGKKGGGGKFYTKLESKVRGYGKGDYDEVIIKVIRV